MSCADYCCNHGCNQGRDCVARKTPAKATERAIDEIVLDGIAIALIVWLVAFVFAPALAGYLTHMRG